MLRILVSAFFVSTLVHAQTCVPMATMRPVDSIGGALTDGACQLSDGSVYDVYHLTLPTFGRLQLNVISNDFPASLYLRDSDGRAVASGVSIAQTIERGDYALLVNAQGPGQFGNYTLSSAFTQEPNTLCRSTTRIGPSATAAGHLVDTSCRQLNNLPYDGYLVSILGSGTLTVALASPNFSGTVTIRDGDGRVAASDPVSASAVVDGDNDYTIVVAGADPSSRGDYQISASFTPAEGETCRSQGALGSPQSVHGAIGDGSCRFSTTLIYQYYDLTVSQAGMADLRVVPASDTNMLVALLDQDGRLLAQDLESGGLEKPIVRQQVPPGKYTVLVIAQPTGGDYSLQYNFYPGPPATCPALNLTPGAQSGALAGGSSCRTQDSLQDTYTFTTASPGTVDITLTSNDFDGSLLLMDGKNNNLSQSDGTDNQNAHIVANLPAGTYALGALSADPGNYTLNYSFTAHALAACPGPQNLALNSGYIGALGPNSCSGQDGQAVDWYQFDNPLDGTVALFMTSGNVDAYLTLLDPQGNPLRRDDNSYGGTDAMIVQWLPAGTYTFGASASGGSQSGQYRVDILSVGGARTPECQPISDLRTGTTQGTLYITSCQYSDDTFADVYRVEAMNSGTLDIEMDSASFDSYLILTDSNGNVIDFDDDSGGGNNARLTTPVDVGTYYLVAKPFVEQGYVVGPYVLIVR
jgi:hypothetical protein